MGINLWDIGAVATGAIERDREHTAENLKIRADELAAKRNALIQRKNKKYDKEIDSYYKEKDKADKINGLISEAKAFNKANEGKVGADGKPILFNKNMLDTLSKLSILVNVGRCYLIDENYLIEKLNNKTLRGAVLDVTSEEPLQKNSKLWNCPNLILTQHTGGGYTNEIIDKVYFFLDNFKRYSKNTSLINIINPSKGY